LPDFEVCRHFRPIGNPDAFIDVLARPANGRMMSDMNIHSNRLPPCIALIVIDMQVGFDDPCWGARNNPDLEPNVAALIATWRTKGAPVIHVYHDSLQGTSPLRGGTPGNAAKPEARPIVEERIYRKGTNCAFIGTNLYADLRAIGVDTLAIVGLTTNHCVSTTARMAGNLGFDTYVAADATAAFDRPNLDGRIRPAANVHDAALSDLQDEFAQVVSSSWLIASADNAGLEKIAHD
jgi:nicotinamidase-related amidase